MTKPLDPSKPEREPVFRFSDYGGWLDEAETVAAVAATERRGTRVRGSHGVAQSDYDLVVQHVPEHRSYFSWVETVQAGLLTYDHVGSRVVLLTSKVLPAYQHHGVATEMIGAVLDDIRTTGKKITIICPVVRAFITMYPQYEDLIDIAHPGVAADDPKVTGRSN